MTSMSIKTLPCVAEASTSRLKSVYSDVSRQKQSNPSAFRSHVQWWQTALTEYVSAGVQPEQMGDINKLSLSARPTLPESFRLDGVGKPLGLGATIAELQQTKHLIPYSSFISSTQSVYSSTWLPYRIASYVVGKPVWWALEQMELVQPETAHGENEMWKRVAGEYVVLELVERAAEALARVREAEVVDGVYDFASFARQFGAILLTGVVLSASDVRVLVKFLQREKQVIVTDDKIIKFIVPGQPTSITAVDRGIVELKNAVRNVQLQIDSIQDNIDEYSRKITAALKAQRKPHALNQLRLKKQLEELLVKRLASLNTLQSTLLSVEAAAQDVEIVKSYESSTATLKNILADPSLKREHIEETMDALALANAEAKDIDSVVRMGADQAINEAGIDDGEIDDELAALMDQVKLESQEAAELKALAEKQQKQSNTVVSVPDTEVVDDADHHIRVAVES